MSQEASDAPTPRRAHDRGGWPDPRPVDPEDHELAPWEATTNALLWVLVSRGVLNVDEFRRAIEGLEPRQYESLSYYQRWLMAIENLLVEKAVLSREEIYRMAGLTGPPGGTG